MAGDEHAGCCAAVWGPDPGVCEGDDAAPAPLVAGAIGRSVVDAQERYRAQFDELWRDVVTALPDD